MAQTQTLATLKDVIKKFLVSVCRFTADAAKEITKNQGYDELDEFYLLAPGLLANLKQTCKVKCSMPSWGNK
jgi:hypothetical protein